MNPNKDNVGFFSKIRWGIGSVSIIIILIILSILFAIEYKEYHNGLFFLSILFAIIAIIIIIVKSSEIIMLINPTPMTLIGKTGIVIKKIMPNKPGVIKVENQLWSAYSDEEIDENKEVEIVNVEGVYLKVKRKD